MTDKNNHKYKKQLQLERQRRLTRSIDEQLYQRFKSRRSHFVKAVLIILAIIVVCFAQVLIRETKLVRQRYNNSKLTKDIKELKLANDSKREALAKLFDVKTLTEKAQEIGLEKPNFEQIIRIPVPQINQLSVKLQSADAEGLKSDDGNVDFNLIYQNLADYYEKMQRDYQSKHKQSGETAVVYGNKVGNGDGMLIREPGTVDKEYVKRQEANAAKAAAQAVSVTAGGDAATAQVAGSDVSDSETANVAASEDTVASDITITESAELARQPETDGETTETTGVG